MSGEERNQRLVCLLIKREDYVKNREIKKSQLIRAVGLAYASYLRKSGTVADAQNVIYR